MSQNLRIDLKAFNERLGQITEITAELRSNVLNVLNFKVKWSLVYFASCLDGSHLSFSNSAEVFAVRLL